MVRARLRACASVAMVVVVGLSGCSDDPVPSDSGVSIAPSDRVTDAVAIALTEEQAERIRDACGDAADLPEPGSPCWDAVEDVPVDDSPSQEPDCEERICLVGSQAESPDVYDVRITDSRPGSPVCQGSRTCQGFAMPAPLVEGMRSEGPPDATPEPDDPEETEPTEPTDTEVEPTEQTEPTEPIEPTDQVEPTDEPTDVPPST